MRPCSKSLPVAPSRSGRLADLTSMDDDQRCGEAQDLGDLLDALDQVDQLLTPEYVEQRLREVLEYVARDSNPEPAG
jgi:hypothetical protein